MRDSLEDRVADLSGVECSALGVTSRLGCWITTSVENWRQKKEGRTKFALLINSNLKVVLSLLGRPRGFRGPVIVTVAERESVQFEYNHEVSPREREKQGPCSSRSSGSARGTDHT